MISWGRGEQGQLGIGDNKNKGDGANEMGNYLPEVQLPTGFVIEQLLVLGDSTLLLSTEGEALAFGYNGVGQIGLSDDNPMIGDQSSDMGDYMDPIDLGTDFYPIQLGGGHWTACAISSQNTAKCWGLNTYGQLGLGDTNNRGREADEMGDNLQIIDFGSGFEAVAVRCSDGHCCAVSSVHKLKCMVCVL